MENKYKYKIDHKKLERVISIGSRDLSSGAKLVLLNLIKRLGGKRYCWPSGNRIGNDVGLSNRQVRSHLKVLKDYGMVEWERGGHLTKKGVKPASNKYDLIYFLTPYETPVEKGVQNE